MITNGIIKKLFKSTIINIIMNYECLICNKKYTSHRSLWNHNKNIH